MHSILVEHLEGYLSGTLAPAERQQLEAHLAECGSCRMEWEALRQSSEWLREMVCPPPPAMDLEPAPGFYGRVIDRIEQDRSVPFWTLLVNTGFGRQVAFACLVLLALVGGLVLATDQTDYRAKHFRERILAIHPTPAPSPRLGPNLERNRDAMLAALVVRAD